MRVGDLVRKVTDTNSHPHVAGIGLVLELDSSAINEQAHAKVMWSGNYGTFWGYSRDLKLVSSATNKKIAN